MSVTRLPLSAARARELLVAAIEEKGADYVFTGTCRYLAYQNEEYLDSATGPACLIGHLLVRDGFSLREIQHQEFLTARDVIAHLYPNTAPEVVTALDQAQQRQDGRYSWGTALEAFDAVLADYEAPVAA